MRHVVISILSTEKETNILKRYHGIQHTRRHEYHDSTDEGQSSNHSVDVESIESYHSGLLHMDEVVALYCDHYKHDGVLSCPDLESPESCVRRGSLTSSKGRDLTYLHVCMKKLLGECRLEAQILVRRLTSGPTWHLGPLSLPAWRLHDINGHIVGSIREIAGMSMSSRRRKTASAKRVRAMRVEDTCERYPP